MSASATYLRKLEHGGVSEDGWVRLPGSSVDPASAGGEGTGPAGGPSGIRRNRRWAIPRTSPGRSTPSSTLCPLIQVPLWLPRSRTRTSESPSARQQWRRETRDESSRVSQEACRPAIVSKPERTMSTGPFRATSRAGMTWFLGGTTLRSACVPPRYQPAREVRRETFVGAIPHDWSHAGGGPISSTASRRSRSSSSRGIHDVSPVPSGLKVAVGREPPRRSQRLASSTRPRR